MFLIVYSVVEGDLTLDVELELFFYKIETGEMDSVEEIIENFNDIFIWL